jgi:hypothetical protein
MVDKPKTKKDLIKVRVRSPHLHEKPEINQPAASQFEPDDFTEEPIIEEPDDEDWAKGA